MSDQITLFQRSRADYEKYCRVPQISLHSAVPVVPPMLSSDGGGSSVQCETVSATIFLSWCDKRSKLCSSFGRENCWDLIHISLPRLSVCILKSSSVLFNLFIDHTEETLCLSSTISDYGINEVALVHVGKATNR